MPFTREKVTERLSRAVPPSLPSLHVRTHRPGGEGGRGWGGVEGYLMSVSEGGAW